MKSLILSLSIAFCLANCAISQEVDCARITTFGKVEICLPQIEGYQECYSNPLVKPMADRTEVESNRVLGFYLNYQTYEKRDSIGFIQFDDYFKIYGVKKIEDYTANIAELEYLQEMTSGNFISKNWESIKKKVDDQGLDIEMGVPVMIRTYNLNPSSFTHVILMKYEIDGLEPSISVMTLNGLLLNERLVFMAYYLEYEREESILELEAKSNAILVELLNAAE